MFRYIINKSKLFPSNVWFVYSVKETKILSKYSTMFGVFFFLILIIIPIALTVHLQTVQNKWSDNLIWSFLCSLRLKFSLPLTCEGIKDVAQVTCKRHKYSLWVLTGAGLVTKCLGLYLWHIMSSIAETQDAFNSIDKPAHFKKQKWESREHR